MLPCGHNEACMYRYRHRGLTRKYCFACIAESFPEANLDDMFKRLREKEKEKDKKSDNPVPKKIEKEHTKDENKQKKV